MSQTATAQGRGKLIVFGEHAVVYGQPAVACSLSSGATATIRPSDSPRWEVVYPSGRTDAETIDGDDDVHRAMSELLACFDLRPAHLRISIELSIPVGAGLGSSAAMAVALARSAAQLQQLDGHVASQTIERAVAASEAVFHGNPSGIDQYAAMGNGFFSFRRAGQTMEISGLDVPAHRWVVARVAPSSPTSAMVAGVASRREKQPEKIAAVFNKIGAIADRGAASLEAGRWSEVGVLMNQNHQLLHALGVSTTTLDRACDAACKAGAFGAKLTGAGGGGCIVALANDTAAVEEALAEFGDVYVFEPGSRP